jgi:hypothetical protein
MRRHGLAWSAVLFMLATSGARAQDAARPGNVLPCQAKGAFSLTGLLTEAEAPQTAAPGRAKGADTGEARIPYFGLFLTQTAGGKDTDKQKDKDKLPQPPINPDAPASDPFASAAPTGSEAPARLNPNMIGDLPGFFSLQRILIGTVQNIVTINQIETESGIIRTVTVKQVPTTVSILARIPLAFSGPIKIAENQSPLPSDRAFLAYNYYNGIQSAGGPGTGGVNSVSTFVAGTQTVINTPIPGGLPSIDLHRQTLGFEKTFFDGAASFGVRLPVAQVQGDGSIGQQDIGDFSTIFNYALFRSQATGSGISAGLMVTAPTGPPNYTAVGDIHPWLLQPFMGYRINADRIYLQGFSSVLTPTDPRYVLAMFNDLSTGYWLYRGNGTEIISAIIPTLEVHVTTPLNHRNNTDLVTLPDFVALTVGVHLGLGNLGMLTIGVTVPVTGPQLFPIEAVTQFNFRF